MPSIEALDLVTEQLAQIVNVKEIADLFASTTITNIGKRPPEMVRHNPKRHYALINARRYDEGYQLMNASLRALNSPATQRS